MRKVPKGEVVTVLIQGFGQIPGEPGRVVTSPYMGCDTGSLRLYRLIRCYTPLTVVRYHFTLFIYSCNTDSNKLDFLT